MPSNRVPRSGHESLSAPFNGESFGNEMIGAPLQEELEPLLSLNERQRAEILAIQPGQIEGDEATWMTARSISRKIGRPVSSAQMIAVEKWRRSRAAASPVPPPMW
jgi:hypothetical protein